MAALFGGFCVLAGFVWLFDFAIGYHPILS